MQVYVVGCFFVYSLFIISQVDTRPSPTSAHLATWILALTLEVVIVGASISIYSHAHRDKPLNRATARFQSHMSDWEACEVIINLFRILLLAALIAFYLVFVVSRNAGIRAAREAAAHDVDEESSLLHGGGEANGRATSPGGPSYGATTASGKLKQPDGTPPGWERPAKTPTRSWWEYLKGYTVFFPFLWPSKDRKLQVVVLICFVLVMLQRVINVLVPMEIGIITNILAGEDGPPRMPWGPILLYLVYRFLQGNQGLLGAARSTLWIPVSQYSYRELSVASFEHVHGLSLDFHLGKKTGEVLSALGKGNSINTFLEQVSFSVVPMLIDLCVAIGYLIIKFDPYYALVVAIVTFWYVYLTIRMAQWRADIRRDMVNADREQDAVKNDSMVSYETVKYFNAEPWEFDRFKGAVQKYQWAEYRVLSSLNLMNIVQNMVFMLGLLVVCFIAAYQVATRQVQIGAFTSLIQYMMQLQQPLNFFGTFYRMIQSAMINAERMLELFKEKPTVVDAPHARPLDTCEGGIRLNDVHIAYDARKPALDGLNFTCAPGTTTALVGESGGGKSTVFRLLFRFYNTQTGSIQVDGHDVQDLTIDSLRKQISVVPQDTVLFNETLMYNLKYANQDVTDAEVFAACRAASIHDKIESFPDGYNTKVGERGLRLSGGEKQRVAIARTILKNPRIIMLDEATAALDTKTEEHIQGELTTLGTGRTMLIIAHRLSTITLADQILVLHEGRVVERGNHKDLLEAKGRYASMWRKQVRAERAALQARVLNDRAEKLKKAEAGSHADGASGDSSPTHSEDEHSQGHGRGGSDQSREASPSSNLALAVMSAGKPHGHP